MIESEEYLAKDRLKPQIIDALGNMRDLCKEIILVTKRHNYDNLIKQLKSLGIFPYLSKVIMCNSLGNVSKADIIKDYTSCTGFFIGDTEEDFEAANSLNIPFLGITTGIRNEKFLNTPFLYKEVIDIDFKLIKDCVV